MPAQKMLPIEIWELLLSYLSLIDLLNVPAFSKMFYRLSRDNQTLKIKLNSSYSLVSCTDFFDRYYDKCLSFSCQLSHRLQKHFDEDLISVVKKKNIMVDLIFEILSFRIFHHLFYCNRGFYMYNKYVFGTRFHVRERNLSDFLNQKFTFLKSYFSGDFVRDIYLDKNFENNYGNFGVLYYEEVDRPFILYDFYLEILCRIFNNFLKKVMPIMLNEFDLNTSSICRRKSFL